MVSSSVLSDSRCAHVVLFSVLGWLEVLWSGSTLCSVGMFLDLSVNGKEGMVA